MKLIKKYFIFILPAFILLGGCEKLLDRKPLTATLDDLSQGNIEGQIFGLYATIKDYDNGHSFSGLAWLAFHNFRSDDSEKGSDLTDGAEWSGIYDNFNYSKDFWGQNLYWDEHYRMIFNANKILQIADSLKLADDASDVFRAEAKFFRAFCYFDMVRTFGQVPLITQRIYTNNDANKPKATIDDIYKLIDADLDFGIAHLPLSWAANYKGRASKGAAESLKARTLLHRQQWAPALALCNAVISSGQYSLYPQFWDIFKETGKNCSESIFEFQNENGPNKTDDYGSWYGTSQGVRGVTADDWNLGWGWNTPTQDLVDAFEPGDVRKASSILFTGQSDDPQHGGYGRRLPDIAPASNLVRKYWNKKVYADPAKRRSTGYLDGAYWVQQQILRYSDVLLMAAEAENETSGPTQTAIDRVNMVRKRAELGEIKPTTKNDFRKAIKQERRVEFALEGHRFYDLVRWGDAESVLGSLGYKPKNKYYPLPQTVVDKSNGVLIQNPDYN